MINLAYDDRGSGEPVVFISGSGGPGRTWLPHQVPAFTAAGYRVITFDNRGIGATENAEGFTTQTMVDDTASLLESLNAAPARIVGVSMGAFIAQELMVARPELVTAAVLMATRGRLDRARQGFHEGEQELYASNVALPPAYEAKVRVLENFSRKTINDDVLVADWITMFRAWPVKRTPGLRTQLSVSPQTSRLAAYRAINTPVLVMGFSDDVITPPHLGREVADALPNGRYVQIPDAGHLGFLERPEAVNGVALKFFSDVKA